MMLGIIRTGRWVPWIPAFPRLSLFPLPSVNMGIRDDSVPPPHIPLHPPILHTIVNNAGIQFVSPVADFPEDK